MADYTQNYNLKKPVQTDFYNIDDFNDNADIIDEALSNKLNSDFSNVSGGAVPISNGGTGATTAASARTNLGVMARDFSNASSTLSISKGGTGATTADGIKNNLGLGTSSWVTFDKTISGSFEIVNSYPYIDFSPNSQTDYEVRIAKNDTNQLNIEAPNGNATLKVNGSKVLTTATLATEIQSLLTGGNISMIKSIQKGTIHAESQTCTVTINTVNTNKSIIINTGSTFHYEEGIGMLELINSNTIQVTKRINKSSLSIYVGFEVIEFY